jgi:hypothetical protein
MFLQPFHDKELHQLLQALSRASPTKITVSCIPNRLYYFVIFIVHTQFTKMAAGRIIQAGGPRCRDPCVVEFIPSCLFNSNFKAGALGVYREIVLSKYSIHHVPTFKIILKESFYVLIEIRRVVR